MTPDETNPNPTTCGYRTILVEIEGEPIELTPEELARPLYGRPSPRRYLEDHELTPEERGETPPGDSPKPV